MAYTWRCKDGNDVGTVKSGLYYRTVICDGETVWEGYNPPLPALSFPQCIDYLTVTEQSEDRSFVLRYDANVDLEELIIPDGLDLVSITDPVPTGQYLDRTITVRTSETTPIPAERVAYIITNFTDMAGRSTKVRWLGIPELVSAVPRITQVSLDGTDTAIVVDITGDQAATWQVRGSLPTGVSLSATSGTLDGTGQGTATDTVEVTIQSNGAERDITITLENAVSTVSSTDFVTFTILQRDDETPQASLGFADSAGTDLGGTAVLGQTVTVTGTVASGHSTFRHAIHAGSTIDSIAVAVSGTTTSGILGGSAVGSNVTTFSLNGTDSTVAPVGSYIGFGTNPDEWYRVTAATSTNITISPATSANVSAAAFSAVRVYTPATQAVSTRTLEVDVTAVSGDNDYFYTVTDSAPNIATATAQDDFTVGAIDATVLNTPITIGWNETTTYIEWTSAITNAGAYWRVQANGNSAVTTADVTGQGTAGDPYRQVITSIPFNISSSASNALSFNIQYGVGGANYGTATTATVTQLPRPGVDFCVLDGIASSGANQYVDIEGVNSNNATGQGVCRIIHDVSRTITVQASTVDTTFLTTPIVGSPRAATTQEVTDAGISSSIPSPATAAQVLRVTEVNFRANAANNNNINDNDDIDPEIGFSDGVVSYEATPSGNAPTFLSSGDVILVENASTYAIYNIESTLTSGDFTEPRASTTGRGYLWDFYSSSAEANGASDPTITSSVGHFPITGQSSTSLAVGGGSHNFRISKLDEVQWVRVVQYAENTHGIDYSDGDVFQVSASTGSEGGGFEPGVEV